MRSLAKYVALVVLTAGVLVPAVAWWAQGSNRKQLVEWVAGASEPTSEPVEIRVRNEPIRGIDVAAALDMWAWNFQVYFPRDTAWKHAWLVVKKKGETTDAFHAGGLHSPDGQLQKPWDCLVAVTPTPVGATVMSCDKVTIRLNGIHGQLIDNPFKVASGMAMQSPKPKFLGNQAILAIVRQSPSSGIGMIDSEEDLKRIPEYDAVLMLVLTESLDPPPVTTKKK
ncbi:MAG TPA: hypothetical protein VKD71_07915 [Gemmataceae bacterium]|nr:hypothetical protein [Gemmataceae bacterium]